MSEAIISLRNNPETGKKDVIIKLVSDADALPHEHEHDHKRLVDALLEGGTLKKKDLGEIWVERVSDLMPGECEETEEQQPRAIKQ